MKALVLLPFFAILSFCMGQEITQITSKETASLLEKDPEIVILDVRTPAEFDEGHLKGAVNIDIKNPDAFGKIDRLDHGAVYVVHCRTNNRSKTAVDYMLSKGFKNLYLMSDGYSGWKMNQLPVIR